jgi:hypothetical protein
VTEREPPPTHEGAAGSGAPAPEPVYVEPLLGGGYAVRLADHHAPVSRHDTEEEAHERAAAYRRGIALETLRSLREEG